MVDEAITVHIAASGLVIGGIVIGSTLLKGSIEETLIGPGKLIEPNIGIILGVIILIISFRRLKIKT